MARARAVEGLDCDEPFREGARKILTTRFEELMSFRDQVLMASDDRAGQEAVHDMRVASRRLRAAMEACSPVFPKRSYRPMLRRVKQLADILGAVRDADVLCDRLVRDRGSKLASQKAVLDALLMDLQGQRHIARELLKEDIEQLDRGGFADRFEALLRGETD